MGLSSFQLLQAFEMGQEGPPIFFYVFDLLRLNGEEERKAKLEKLLKKPPGIIRYSASIENGGEELLDRARELGLEGLRQASWLPIRSRKTKRRLPSWRETNFLDR